MLNIYSVFIILCLFQPGSAIIYRIFISNQAIAPYLGTESCPFATLYSGFEYVVTYYTSATPFDEFHFLMVAVNSSQPFYLEDNEISNAQLFKSFQGNNTYIYKNFFFFKVKFLLKVVMLMLFQLLNGKQISLLFILILY